jgi:hypothetical protein
VSSLWSASGSIKEHADTNQSRASRPRYALYFDGMVVVIFDECFQL